MTNLAASDFFFLGNEANKEEKAASASGGEESEGPRGEPWFSMAVKQISSNTPKMHKAKTKDEASQSLGGVGKNRTEPAGRGPAAEERDPADSAREVDRAEQRDPEGGAGGQEDRTQQEDTV